MSEDVFNPESPSFELLAQENGFRYWYASQLAQVLGYDDVEPIRKAINKAMGVCMSLNIQCGENFQQVETEFSKFDFKLSRFACYLTVMNGDVRNALVAKAQAYFANLAETVQNYIEQADGVERILIRSEISDREKTLSGVAHQHGIVEYAFFQNAGYRGMYNMNLARLKEFKGMVGKGSLLDFMGKDELAANLFRITQTEAKIKNSGIKGQSNLEITAEQVGAKVRSTMIELSGVAPEHLPLHEDIKTVKKGIKRTHTGLKAIDNKKKKILSSKE